MWKRVNCENKVSMHDIEFSAIVLIEKATQVGKLDVNIAIPSPSSISATMSLVSFCRTSVLTSNWTEKFVGPIRNL